MRGSRGVTLIELLVVVAIVALMAGITAPTVSAGLETLRLRSATDDVLTFLNTGLLRTERRQQAVEIVIHRRERRLEMRSTDPTFARQLHLPDSITIEHVLPEPEDADPFAPRSILLLPGGTIPRVGLELANAKGRHRLIRIDPITGTANAEEAVNEQK